MGQLLFGIWRPALADSGFGLWNYSLGKLLADEERVFANHELAVHGLDGMHLSGGDEQGERGLGDLKHGGGLGGVN